MSAVWVVINVDQAYNRLNELIDAGYLSEATGLYHSIDSFLEKMKTFIQEFGGYMPLGTCSRIVMNIPVTASDQLPNIIDGFSETVSGKVAAGIGLTFNEAAKAAQRSTGTGEIELFGEDGSEILERADVISTARRTADSIILPPNVFDPTVPDDFEEKKAKSKPDDEVVLRQPLEQEMQAEGQYLQMIAQQMGMGQPEVPQQGEPEQGNPQSGQKMPTRDLLEALHGEQVEGYEPNQPAAPMQEEAPQGQPEAKEEQLEQVVDDAENKAMNVDNRLAETLHNIKSQIPQIMALANQNPAAFKQTMNLIQKLISAANQKSATKKSEERQEIEAIEKSLVDRLRELKSTAGLKLPEGSRKGRFKKVRVNGRLIWREMSSGIVQDHEGKPISVKESNKDANAHKDLK